MQSNGGSGGESVYTRIRHVRKEDVREFLEIVAVARRRGGRSQQVALHITFVGMSTVSTL